MASIERRRVTVTAPDGATSTLQLHHAAAPRALLYWVPALGVGIGPNETFADALAERGFAVAIHEWRGLGSSNRRAGRSCDWGYRELLDLDLPAGMDAAQALLPGVPLWLGGHSLGGQFALIEATRARRGLQGVLLVASGQPHWRQFPAPRRYGVLAFALSIPLLTRVVGHFPGTRLGFAGREAGRLLREWSRTCVRGDYRTGGYGAALDEALSNHRGRVLALRLSQDALAPPGAIARLQRLAPAARWQVRDLDAAHFERRRPDHFGWLREPRAVVAALESFADAGPAP